jgi:GntR family transcriptional regulator
MHHWQMPRVKSQRYNLFNPFPKYLQVRRALERRMRESFEDGQQLPTEHELQVEFRVSRDTIRQALAGLEADGLLLRQAGRGTFFVRPADGLVRQKLTGLAEDFSALQLDTVAELLEACPVQGCDEEARIMGMQGRSLFRIVRSRQFEGTPLAVHEAFVSESLGRKLAAQDLSRGSIAETLTTKLKLRYEEEFQRIEAVAADLPWARVLDVRIGEPLLLVTRLLRVKPDNAAVLFRSWYRADRYCYTIDLSAPVSQVSRRRF